MQPINEHYVNAFTPDQKKPYAQQAWDILQQSYAPIGGIKGSGFGSVEDMIAKIPIWKLVTRGGKVVAAAFYKDSNGRKRVAIATDGSAVGQTEIRKIVAQDFERSYGEVSGPSFGSMVKTLGVDFLRKYAKTPEQAEEILGELLMDADPNDPMVKRVPELATFMYAREIGGHYHTKIMFGTHGKHIVYSEAVNRAAFQKRLVKQINKYIWVPPFGSKDDKLPAELEAENAKVALLQSTKIKGVQINITDHAGSRSITRRPDLTANDWNILLQRAVDKIRRHKSGKFMIKSMEYKQFVIMRKVAPNQIVVVTVYPFGEEATTQAGAAFVVIESEEFVVIEVA